jgi:hypothetical protein
MLAHSLVFSVKVPPSLSLHSFSLDTNQHSFGGIDTRIKPWNYPFVRIITQTKIVKKQLLNTSSNSLGRWIELFKKIGQVGWISKVIDQSNLLSNFEFIQTLFWFIVNLHSWTIAYLWCVSLHVIRRFF